MLEANIKIETHSDLYKYLWGKYLDIFWIYFSRTEKVIYLNILKLKL